MKKWEYLIVDFEDRRVERINGHPANDFVESRVQTSIFGTYFDKYVPAQGTYIVDFLKGLGCSGWEAVSVQAYSTQTIRTILFKRELEEEKKGD